MKPRALLGPCVVVLAAACSPATPQPVAGPTLPPPLDAGPTGPSFASPAQWLLARSPAWRELARVATDQGTLLVGQGGERWLERAEGTTESAASLAPAALVGAGKIEGGYRFVDAVGGVWEAQTPLGPLARTGQAPAKSEHFAMGKVALVAVDAAGELSRSTDGGRTWGKVPVGPREGVLVSVAMHGTSGLALAAPQRIFATKDDGQTWRPVTSPGIGAREVLAEDGELHLRGVETTMRFDPQTDAFVALAPKRGGSPSSAGKRDRTTFERRIEGRRVVVVESNPESLEHKVAIFDLGANAPMSKKVDALDGCHAVHAALRGPSVWLACDAPGSVDAGIDRTAAPPGRYFPSKMPPVPKGQASGDAGRATGFVTKLVRSDDGGKTWVDDALVEGGIAQVAEEAVAVGPEGWVFLGQRCATGYPRTCVPARVRTSTTARFVDVGAASDDDEVADDAVHYVRVASHPSQSVVFGVGVARDRVALYQWTSGAPAPQLVAQLGTRTPQTPTLSVDDDGTARGVVPGDKAMTFELTAGKLTTAPIAFPLRSASVAGRFGLGVTTDGTSLETTDGGKTWLRVAQPSSSVVVQCSTDGCVTTRGVRAGWDGKALTAPGDAAKDKPVYARGLKCTAKDAWVSLGGGQLPGADNVDQGPHRWVLPTRDAPGTVGLQTAKWGDAPLKTARVALVGPAPQPPKFGASTTMHVQPHGVVVLRYSYLRERKGPGRYNPVDMQAAWYRYATGKVSRAALPQIPPFRVNRDPQEGALATPPYGEPPEILSLGPKGLYFRSPSFPEDEQQWTLHHFRDDGKVERTKSEEGRGDVLRAGDVGGTTAVFGLQGDDLDLLIPSEHKKVTYSVLAGSDDAVDFLDFGGKTYAAATLRWASAPRAWAVPLAGAPDLAAGVQLPTQAALGDVPKACPPAPAGPGEPRIAAPWVLGSRRPVLVETDGAHLVLATGRAVLRAPSLGAADACGVAFEAMQPEGGDGDEQYSALVFLDDPTSSVLFRTKGDTWPTPVHARPLTCTFSPVPLPSELEEEPGFVRDAPTSSGRR